MEGPLPRWGTPATDRPNRLAGIQALARRIGLALLPWQQHVLAVATEQDAGRPVYREVVVTVPRQSGKTTVLLLVELDRALLWGGPQTISYSAQTGTDARRKVLDDQLPVLKRSPLAGTVGRVLQGIPTQVAFRSGSRLDVATSSDRLVHGQTVHLGVVDEAWADDDDRREQALVPAMATVGDAQMWVASTAGTERSTYLRRKVETGRLLAGRGVTEGTAYFEWSAPDDAAHDDPAVWAGCMPALGRLIDRHTVEHALGTMRDDEFRRAWLNQWVEGSASRVIPVELWERVIGPQVTPAGGLVFAVDAPPERDWASVAVADRDGRVELIEHQPGVGWLIDWISDRARRWRAPVALSTSGPLGGFADALERAGVTLRRYNPTEAAHASVGFYDAIIDQRVQVRSDPRLDGAVAGATKRPRGEVWLWGRLDPTIVVSPLVAASLAYDAAQRIEAAPSIRSLADVP